jgi:hypothetical protein
MRLKVLIGNRNMRRSKTINSSLLFLSILSVCFFFISCTSNEIGNGKDVNPNAIYFDYRIWGNEGDDAITVMLQYRFGGSNGTTLVLEEPSKVELDGQQIITDSSRMTGAFYEMVKPVKEFTGKHSIVFTDINQKQYKEEFSFQPIALRTTIPAEIERDELVFELDGLDPIDYVRVLLNDTSFVSEGINRMDTVRNGRVIISRQDLETVVNGPIHLELYKEVERPVRNGTDEGGKLAITYGVKREFVLRD